jgi:glycosyltransferase 2 family protein
MKKTILTILQYILFLGLGIWIIYHMLHQLDDDKKAELANAITNANVWYLVPVFFIGFLSHFFRAMRWRYLLETVDLKPSLVNTTFAVLIGYIANTALPRAGEVAKCTVLAKYEKMPAHKMIGTIVAERAFDMVTLLVVALIAFALQAEFVSHYVTSITGSLQTKFESSKTILLVITIVGLMAIPLGIMLYRRHKETKVGKFVKELMRGVFSIILMKKRWEFLGFTFLIWFMYLLQLYVGFSCLQATAHLSMSTALVVLVYGSIGMIVTPGGIGLYTLLVAQMLVAYNIDIVPAQAFGWIAWVAQTAVIIILGLVALVAIHPYNRKRNGQTTVGTA